MSIHGELSTGAMLVPQFPFSELEKENSDNSQESKKSQHRNKTTTWST